MTDTQNQDTLASEVVIEGKPTLVLGASTNPERTSYTAINMLRDHGHTVYALGLKPGVVRDVSIGTDPDALPTPQLHTITLYLNEKRQAQYYDYILNLQPKRLIFNPGAENSELAGKARAAGIEVVEACTLVMLSFRQF